VLQILAFPDSDLRGMAIARLRKWEIACSCRLVSLGPIDLASTEIGGYAWT
jgi:hypothetical protein